MKLNLPNAQNNQRTFMINQIGNGNYGKVYNAKPINWKNHTQEIAIKIQQEMSQNESDFIKGLIQYQNQYESDQTKSSQIVRIYEMMEIENKFYTLMELGEMDLYKFLQQNIGKLTLAKKFLFSNKYKIYDIKISRSILYLHFNNLIHRDIKPENYVKFGDSFKLIDFGIIRRDKNDPKTMYVGSPLMQAPEIKKGVAYYSKEIDIWSLGCTFIEILQEKELEQSNFSNFSIHYSEQVQNSQEIEKQIKDLIIGMLQKDPQKRLNIETVSNTLLQLEQSLKNNQLQQNVQTIQPFNLQTQVNKQYYQDQPNQAQEYQVNEANIPQENQAETPQLNLTKNLEVNYPQIVKQPETPSRNDQISQFQEQFDKIQEMLEKQGQQIIEIYQKLQEIKLKESEESAQKEININKQNLETMIVQCIKREFKELMSELNQCLTKQSQQMINNYTQQTFNQQQNSITVDQFYERINYIINLFNQKMFDNQEFTKNKYQNLELQIMKFFEQNKQQLIDIQKNDRDWEREKFKNQFSKFSEMNEILEKNLPIKKIEEAKPDTGKQLLLLNGELQKNLKEFTQQSQLNFADIKKYLDYLVKQMQEKQLNKKHSVEQQQQKQKPQEILQETLQNAKKQVEQKQQYEHPKRSG